jgi:hypothetical protein
MPSLAATSPNVSPDNAFARVNSVVSSCGIFILIIVGR